jgi:hypothetical protein
VVVDALVFALVARAHIEVIQDLRVRGVLADQILDRRGDSLGDLRSRRAVEPHRPDRVLAEDAARLYFWHPAKASRIRSRVFGHVASLWG